MSVKKCPCHLYMLRRVKKTCITLFLQNATNSIRLRGGPLNGQGRVQVVKYGKWGAICSNKWDSLSANVACRQLGFGTAKHFYKSTEFGRGLYCLVVSANAVVTIQLLLFLILYWYFLQLILFRFCCVIDTCSFICQGTSTRRQRSDLFVFESSCYLILPV